MLKSPTLGLLLAHIFLLALSTVSANDDELSPCNCEDESGLWSNGRIIDCQRVSDFLIAVAYFSIPIELLYFVSCSNVPFKWVLFEFILFIVLCGLTHLLNGWTYGPHPFQLILALTIFKILTALVSCATAITLFTLIPLLLKVKVREFMLKKKTWDLGREFGIIMKQKEAGLHVRMLTRIIRNSLDRHTILDTTLKELSKTLMLQNCAIWMPNELKTMMNLTHVLSQSNYSDTDSRSVPVTDPDVVRIEKSEDVNFLRPDSALAAASSGGSGDPGPVAAIRMPMLRVSNFNEGAPEMVQQCYAILVLVLPCGQRRMWTTHELEIVKVVADQVAVALSHAAVLEESQLMREKLQVQNRALQQAEMNVMMASQARVTFQNVMSEGMKKPMHSILGLISLIQDEKLSEQQRLIVDAMMKTGKVLATLLNDVMEISTTNSGRFALEMKPFDMHAILREGACTAKWLCAYAGAKFTVDIDKSIPCIVLGDEKRLMQLILRMVVNMLNGNVRGETVIFRVISETSSGGSNFRTCPWNQNVPDGDLCIRIEMEKGISCTESNVPNSRPKASIRWNINNAVKDGLGFSVCKKIVKMMQGNIWINPDSQGFPQTTAMILTFQHQGAMMAPLMEYGGSGDNHHSNTILKGLHVLLADADNLNRVVTKKCLEKLGCWVTAVESGYDCLSAMSPASSLFRVVLLDLQMPGWDGFEIATRIRKFRSHNRPLIIALTASLDENIYKKCQHIGMNGMIRKPVMLKGIAKELRRVLLHSHN